MRVALITDTHYGIRNDSTQFHEYMGKFFSKVFFPTLEAEGVEKVIHLGDIVDRRKYINFLTSQNLREQLIEPLVERKMPMAIIVGNHDTYYKNTNDVNALNEVLRGYDGIQAFTNTTEVELGQTKVLYIPWICPDNYDQSMKSIKETTATIALGHLEIAGFTLHPGHVMDETGLSPKVFDKFELVCSGHFHHRHQQGGIHYLGCPYEMTWSDYDNQKGFHIFDTDTRELDFIPNPYYMFTRVECDESGINCDEHDIRNHYVRLVVKDNLTQSQIDGVVSTLEKYDPYEIKVIDESSLLIQEEMEIDAEELQDTLSIVGKYIEGLETKVDHESIRSKVYELYHSAMTVE